MATTIKAEAFDSVTAPAQPATWTTDGAAATSAATPRSGVNSYLGGALTSYDYWPTQDGNAGDQQVTLYILPSANSCYAFGRITTVPIAAAAGTGYLAGINSANGARMFRRLAGVTVQLGSTIAPAPAFVTTDYHLQTIVCNGTSISLQVQRADGSWMTSAGGWSATQQAVITVTDSNITGQGYAGIQIGASTRIDDWLFESLATAAVTAGSGWTTVKRHREHRRRMLLRDLLYVRSKIRGK